MNLFTKQLGWTKAEVHSLLKEARKDLEDLGKHVYLRILCIAPRNQLNSESRGEQ